MKKELLAPAGDIEAGYAALYYGADAVYLGLEKFSARATATNFSEEALNEFVAYAHFLKRKVFVAINTLIQENELKDLCQELDICSRCRVDAVIIQDLGVARIIKENYPELEIHASTQMAIHNKEGALALKNLGFSRVVLARELTLPEIEEIAAIPELETEAFIHGALCYSYSGLCMFSSLDTGRSANRGKCLYPCRAAFKSDEGDKHFFSMKDMALQAEVLKMPVTSLKIEGRKKSALYVAAVTDYYRRILEGRGADEQRENNIKQIFSRPWTKFHFNGRNKEIIDRDFVGHRGLLIGKIEQLSDGSMTFVTQHGLSRYDGLQIDVEGEEKPFGFSLQVMKIEGKTVFDAKKGNRVEIVLPRRVPALKKGQNIYLSSSTNVKNAYDYEKSKAGGFILRHPIVVNIEIAEDEIQAKSGDYQYKVEGKFTTAEHPEKIVEAAEKAFTKTGDTIFELQEIKLENPKELFVPVSIFNELRRGLYEKIEIKFKSRNIPIISEPRENKKPQWIIKIDDLNSLAKLNLDDFAEVIFMLAIDTDIESLKIIPKDKLRLALPCVCRKVEVYQGLVNALIGKGYAKWEIANYWGMEILSEQGLDIAIDSSIYMLNSQAIQMAKDMKISRVTLSVEDTMENMKKLAIVSPLPVCMVVYQDVPLFISAGCVRTNSCKTCSKGEKWTTIAKDTKNYKVLSKDCQTMVFAERALCIALEAKEIKADFYRLDILYKKYTPENVYEIFEKICQFEDAENTIKANLNRGKLF